MNNTIWKLQENFDRRCGLNPSSLEAENISPETRKLIDNGMLVYDYCHLPDLMADAKKFAGGSGTTSDAAVPAILQRTVIRETLMKTNALDFVDTGVAKFAPSIEVPYSYRDTTAAGRSDTRTYEGQEISRAGVIQTREQAYPIPQKLSFETSDELRLLTNNGMLDWNIVNESIANTSQIIAEDTDRLLYNEMLQASDEYGATVVANEDLELQADGTNRVFLLANFPVVRPRKVYDLQGTQVGSTINPITVTYNSIAALEYDGTGTQAAGTYFVLNYSHGEIYLVNETGVIQTPADTVAYTISYSSANNRYNFDTEEGSTETAIHWDKFLYRYGLRKSELEDGRYHEPDFGLMSGVAFNQVEQARKFAANFKTPGTDLTQTGDLGRIKDVPNSKTGGPGLWMGDSRVLIGQRGTTRFRLTKPWEMKALENQRGPNGRFTGKKEAYGDQWIVVHTPTQLKRAYTSIVLYSGTERISRVDP